MNVVIEKVKVERKLTLGDIVATSLGLFIVMESRDFAGDKAYVARTFDGKSILNKYFSSLEELEEHLVSVEATVYSKEEYELVLRRKE